jgi:hypothetical protein
VRVTTIFRLILQELGRGYLADGRRWASAHEGRGVLMEHFDDFERALRETSHPEGHQVESHGISLAAHVIRFLVDLTREGCFWCADQTCDVHAAQDKGGDYELSHEEWMRARAAGIPPELAGALRAGLAMAEPFRSILNTDALFLALVTADTTTEESLFALLADRQHLREQLQIAMERPGTTFLVIKDARCKGCGRPVGDILAKSAAPDVDTSLELARAHLSEALHRLTPEQRGGLGSSAVPALLASIWPAVEQELRAYPRQEKEGCL